MAAARGAVRGEGGGSVRLKVASAVNNFFRGNIRGPLLCALTAMPSNYSPRPPVIIPITSRTEESVTQRTGQGEGKAMEQQINISFTHPASPSRLLDQIHQQRRTEGESERENRRKREGEGKEKKQGPLKTTTQGL